MPKTFHPLPHEWRRLTDVTYKYETAPLQLLEVWLELTWYLDDNDLHSNYTNQSISAKCAVGIQGSAYKRSKYRGTAIFWAVADTITVLHIFLSDGTNKSFAYAHGHINVQDFSQLSRNIFLLNNGCVFIDPTKSPTFELASFEIKDWDMHLPGGSASASDSHLYQPLARTFSASVFSPTDCGTTIVVCSVFVTLAWIALILRIWTKATIVRFIGADDYLILAATVCTDIHYFDSHADMALIRYSSLSMAPQ